MTMKKIVRVAVTAAASLALVACGSDSDGGSDKDEVVDLLLQAADEVDVSVDEDCVREAVDRLSDEDASAIVDAGIDGDPEISDAGGEVLADVFLCEN